MITDKISELEKLTARAAELKAEIEREQTAALAALPAQYGFSTLESFIKALKAAAGKPVKRGAGKPKAAAAGGKRRARTTITPEIKAKVIELAKAGKTGAEIAAEVGISLPSVQNIKKAAGLVKAR